MSLYHEVMEVFTPLILSNNENTQWCKVPSLFCLHLPFCSAIFTHDGVLGCWV